jgi:hypothetical protein
MLELLDKRVECKWYSQVGVVSYAAACAVVGRVFAAVLGGSRNSSAQVLELLDEQVECKRYSQVGGLCCCCTVVLLY